MSVTLDDLKILRVYKAKLISRMLNKFDIREAPEDTLLAQLIILSTDVDKLLQDPKIDRSVNDVSAGTAVCYTVPAGKRITITAFTKSDSAGNTQLRAYKSARAGGDFIILTANTTSLVVEPSTNLILEEDDYILMTQGGGGDSAVPAMIAYLEEDAYD